MIPTLLVLLAAAPIVSAGVRFELTLARVELSGAPVEPGAARVELTVAQAGPAVAPVEDPALHRYRRAAEYSAARGGFSMLVMRGADIVFEDYPNGHGAKEPHPLASGTKSFWGVAAMAAIEDGILDLDEKVCDTITEWEDDAARCRVHVRHLLDLSSGLDPSPDLLQGPRTGDKYEAALSVALIAAPGKKFQYGPASYYVFGELLRRKLADRKEDPLAYLERRILKPIGLSYAFWTRDKAGHPQIPSGAFLTAREWARFGAFVKNAGRAGDRQVVDAKLLDRCLEPSRANAAYGLTLWLAPDPEEELAGPAGTKLPERRKERVNDPAERIPPAPIPKDLVFAAGLGGQRMYVVRSLDLVVVRQGDTKGVWSDTEFLGLLLPTPAPSTAPPDAPPKKDR